MVNTSTYTFKICRYLLRAILIFQQMKGLNNNYTVYIYSFLWHDID